MEGCISCRHGDRTFGNGSPSELTSCCATASSSRRPCASDPESGQPEREPLKSGDRSPRDVDFLSYKKVSPDRRFVVVQTGWHSFRYRELEAWEDDPQHQRGTCLGLICRKCCLCFWVVFGLCLVYAILLSRTLHIAPAAGTRLPLSPYFWPFYLPPPHNELGLQVITADQVPVARVLRLPSGEVYVEVKGTPQPGVTPEMLRWMHANLDAVVRWRGKEVPMYWLLHPEDHVLAYMSRDAGGYPVAAGFLEAADRAAFSPLTWLGGLGVARWPRQSERSGWRLQTAMPVLPLTTVAQVSWSETDAAGSLVQHVGITTGFKGGWSWLNAFLRLIPISLWESQVNHNVCEASIPYQFLPELYNAEQDPIVPGKRAWDVAYRGYDTSFLERVKDATAYLPADLAAEAVNPPPSRADSRSRRLPDGFPDLNEFPDLGKATLLGDFVRMP